MPVHRPVMHVPQSTHARVVPACPCAARRLIAASRSGSGPAEVCANLGATRALTRRQTPPEGAPARQPGPAARRCRPARRPSTRAAAGPSPRPAQTCEVASNARRRRPPRLLQRAPASRRHMRAPRRASRKARHATARRRRKRECRSLPVRAPSRPARNGPPVCVWRLTASTAPPPTLLSWAGARLAANPCCLAQAAARSADRCARTHSAARVSCSRAFAPRDIWHARWLGSGPPRRTNRRISNARTHTSSVCRKATAWRGLATTKLCSSRKSWLATRFGHATSCGAASSDLRSASHRGSR